jgi:hypothetical protein
MTNDAGSTHRDTHREKTMSTTTTAEDTLTQRRRDGSVEAGGHLVAKALKAEGVDTNFALCGGHDTTRRD